jgi:hypothetical protein
VLARPNPNTALIQIKPGRLPASVHAQARPLQLSKISNMSSSASLYVIVSPPMLLEDTFQIALLLAFAVGIVVAFLPRRVARSEACEIATLIEITLLNP